MIQTLPQTLSHLTDSNCHDILMLADNFSTLFNDVPSRTTQIKYDIDVGNAKLIKQHL